MTIKLADNEAIYKECLDFLAIQRIYPISGTNLFYVKEEGEIKGVAGWNKDSGSCIDPFYTTSNNISLQMYRWMEGYLAAIGFQHIQVFTNDEKTIAMLINKLGYKIWNSQITALLKETI